MDSSLSKTSFIRLVGCRQHNLKNISLSIPKHAITVITGVSGSGKSSLAFDTLFAEGQRRYLEYLSSQARTWIKQMPKPDVDLIEGLSPTLAVGQGRYDLSFRGTVATYTDIYDFLTLLFARIGEQHSPATGKRLLRYSRQEIIELILKDYSVGARLQLLAPIKFQNENGHEVIARLQNMGYIRLRIDEQEWTSDSPMPPLESLTQIEVVVDRLEIKEGIRDRLATSVETTMDLSQGILKVLEGKNGSIRYFTEIYVCPETSLAFAPLEPADFNFNSSHGACPLCKGAGGDEKINPALLFDDSKSPLQNQIRSIVDHLPKKTASSFQKWLQCFYECYAIHEETTNEELSAPTLNKLLYGSKDLFKLKTTIDEEIQTIQSEWKGLIPFLNRLLNDKKSKGSLEELPSVEWQLCPACKGAKLKPASLACLIKGKNIHDWCALTVSELLAALKKWTFEKKEAFVSKEILPQIEKRLRFLEQVGLGYLELNRPGKTLSDGEAQRIQLASQIGAKLSGLIYILDEPSLGLHPQDMQYLLEVIQELKGLGNTIVLVEHERLLITQADHIIEIGPGAGKHGGKITFEGNIQQLLDDPSIATGQWLSGKKKFPPPPKRKRGQNRLYIENVSLHNLRNFSITIPLGCLVGFCGVSGSGKSTLALDLIGTELRQSLVRHSTVKCLKGGESIKKLVTAEKLAERFSARSIPATYVGLMNPLRQLFAQTKLAKARGYTAARFSLNKRGGRCEACEGLGQLRINMQLMPDLFIPCEVCMGKRYNYETLQVNWENRNMADVLALSIEEAVEAFKYVPTLAPTLELMQELGLGYMNLGQPFHTLSGGEIQRLKLVSDLVAKTQEPTLYILDEPSAGLHSEDIAKLVQILHRLVDQGHSVFVIEHHLELLRQCDWLIELGPGGGPQGGQLIFEGTPAQLAKASTPTGRFLALIP